MTWLLVITSLCLVASVAYTSYRLGREDGWQAGVAWAIRNREDTE